jgi:hypothetical protein
MKLRDRIAHPRTVHTRSRTAFLEGSEPPLFPASYLSKAVSHAKALRAEEDVTGCGKTANVAVILLIDLASEAG